MPEGDTIHRSAAALRIALVGRPTTGFDAPSLFGPRPSPGRVIERVESHGKHLEIIWDDDLVLHTHMRMTGSWHLYRRGERWRKPSTQMRVVIEVPEWVAVCFNAPVVETYRDFDPYRHPGFGRLGPDLCTASVEDLHECAQRLYHYAEPEMTVADAILDQHVMCGVGNVYRSEVLWACEIDPFGAVGDLEPSDCVQLVHTATRMLRANLRHARRVTQQGIAGGLAVYGRNGQRCERCGDTVLVRRIGDFARLVYWCPGCQVRCPARPDGVEAPVRREMDPHPAASQYLADLPWRRDPLAG
ncbi:MAG: DNA-formamidopyrimidine glycosylase family protein [Ilumatobacteraceae bacterium]